MKIKSKKPQSPEAAEKRAKRRRLHKDNYHILMSIVLLLLSITIINTVYVIHKSNVEPSLVGPNHIINANHVYTSLQTGIVGSTKATISKFTENSKIDQAFTIDPSETMLIMDIKITNLSNSTQHLLPSIQLYARSDQGTNSALHASMYVTNPLKATDLAPGQSASGQISFNVPKIASRPLVYVDTGWDNYPPIVFDALH